MELTKAVVDDNDVSKQLHTQFSFYSTNKRYYINIYSRNVEGEYNDYEL